MTETTATKTKPTMGQTYTLGRDRQDWLWNVAKRALPEGAKDSDVLRYMKLLAQENGIELDAKNDIKDTPANRAKVGNGKLLKIPQYNAPSMQDIKDGKAELAPYMRGESVKELKKMLNERGAKLDANNDLYDPDTKAAYDSYRRSQNLPVRNDGVINNVAMTRLASPTTQNDKVEKSDGKTKVAPTEAERTGPRTYWDPNQKKLVTIESKQVEATWKDQSFNELAKDAQDDVLAAMKDKPDDVQERISSLAKKDNFKQLSAENRKAVLELAEKNGDPEMQKTLETIAGTDKFHGADDKVKAKVIEALRKDPKNAKQVDNILNTVQGTEAQLQALDKVLAGKVEEKGPANIEELEKNGNFSKLAEDQKRDVRRAMKDAPAEAQGYIAKLASDPKFGLLSAAFRKQILSLAESSDKDMRAALDTIVSTDKFHGADNLVKMKVIDLLSAAPKHAAEITAALSKGTTKEQMDALEAIAKKASLEALEQ